jgi:hypothetical protein
VEAADRNFIQAMRYLRAVKRCERWMDDDELRAVSEKLAANYRRNAMACVLKGVGATRGDSDAAPGREPWGNPADCAQRGGDHAQWK